MDKHHLIEALHGQGLGDKLGILGSGVPESTPATSLSGGTRSGCSSPSGGRLDTRDVIVGLSNVHGVHGGVLLKQLAVVGAAHGEGEQMVLGVTEGVHIIKVGTSSRGILSLKRDLACRSPDYGGERISQGGDVVLHVLQIPDVQLCYLVPQAGVFLDQRGLWQILRLVPVDFLPDVVAGVDVGHHVVQHSLF
jgi:hypothetical protein